MINTVSSFITVAGPPRPAYKFKAHNTIVNRTVETTFTWKAAYGWKIPQYFELDQRDSDSQIWVEVYKIAADGERSVTLELEHSQEYHFRIRACNVYGCSRKNTPEVKLTTESTYFQHCRQFSSLWYFVPLIIEQNVLLDMLVSNKQGTII